MTRRRVLVSLAAASLALAPAVALAVPAHASVAAPALTPGDLVIYRVGDGSAALTSGATPVFFDDVTTAGVPGTSIALPTVASGANKRLTASGTASSEGLLSLSADGRYVVATGYNAAVGTSGLSSSAAATIPRTVALVNGAGTVDTSTSLTDAADGNNPRSATSVDGTQVYVGGGASGIRYAADGATTSTAITSTTYKNTRQLEAYQGQLYASADPTKAGLTVAAIGSGYPTTAVADTAVKDLYPYNASASVDSYAFAFTTLGSGTAPDTLYVADNSAGLVRKFSLSGTTWSQTGSVSVPGVAGVAANDVGGTVKIYATTASALVAFQDTSGAGGTLTGSATTIRTAPSNEAFRGVTFAPGTTFGSGGGTTTPPTSTPTITASQSAFPEALGDPTQPTTMSVTVGDSAYPDPSQLTVTAAPSNASIGSVAVTGTGATRTLTFTPSGVGRTTVTLTVTAPDGGTATTTVDYGVSADAGDPTARYYDGAANASAEVDLGNGYFAAFDDENNVVRVYNATQSGPPVAQQDLSSFLGTTPGKEADFEGATRVGSRIYFTGSMSHTSSGVPDPNRSRFGALDFTGVGASTVFTPVGDYTGLENAMVAWDDNNGAPLGLDASVNGNTADSHQTYAFNVEGLEFAAGSTSTAYFAFRGALQPPTGPNARTLALVVPVTNADALAAGTSTTPTFGSPLEWNLGGLGVRDLKRNADGTFLIIAGTADSSNNDFELYTWDGVAGDPPIRAQGLSHAPGAWEGIVSVPEPLTDGSTLELVQDDGDYAWYADGATSKDTLPAGLQKSLGETITYNAPALDSSSTAVSSSDSEVGTDDSVTFTATVSGGPTNGTVTFTDGSTTPATTLCSDVALTSTTDGETATCTTSFAHAGSHSVTATFNGNGAYATSSASTTETVDATSATVTADDVTVAYGTTPTFTYTTDVPSDAFTTTPTCGVSGDDTEPGTYAITCAGADAGSDYDITYVAGTLTVTTAGSTTTVTADTNPAVTDQNVTYTVTVTGADGSTPTGTVDVAGCTDIDLTNGSATCTTDVGAPGTTTVTATYSGDSHHATSSGSLSEEVDQASTSTLLLTDDGAAVAGRPFTLYAAVTPQAESTGTPTGTVTFTDGTTTLCSAVPVTTYTQCTATLGGGSHTVVATYSGDAGFTGSSDDIAIAVAGAATTTTLTSSANPSAYGSTVVLTAAVAPTSGTGTPTGTVTFTVTAPNGTTVPCAGKVDDPALDGTGSASCTLTNLLPSRTYAVSAAYAGSADFQASSATLTQVVSKAPTTVALSTSPQAPVSGDPVTITASVTSPYQTPTGSVKFAVKTATGATVTCTQGNTATLSAGTATCTLPPLTVAKSAYSVTVTHAASSFWLASTGSTTITVTRATPSLVVGSTPGVATSGTGVTINASLSTTNGAVPTGAVTFTTTDTTGATVSACTKTLSSGAATCKIAGNAVKKANGPYSVTVSYPGSTEIAPATQTYVLQIQ